MHPSPQPAGQSTTLPLDCFPHLVESILATAIRSIPRPIVFATAPSIAAYLNVASRSFNGGRMLSPSLVAIFRMPWIDTTLAAQLGDLWLFKTVDTLTSRRSPYFRPVLSDSGEIAHHAGRSGNLALVQHVVEASNALSDKYWGVIVQQASIHGHVHVLDWFAHTRPQALQTESAFHLYEQLEVEGHDHVRVLEWWVQHHDLRNSKWEKTRATWQLWVLAIACKYQRVDVVDYFLGVLDYHLIHKDPKQLPHTLSLVLAAAAYTGDLAFFTWISEKLPEAAISTRVVAFACGSGNLQLAKHCHARLTSCRRDDNSERTASFDQQEVDLCYLLATAVGQDENALGVLNWLHAEVGLSVTGHFVGSYPFYERVLGKGWPREWGYDLPYCLKFCMHLATRVGSVALLEWWAAHARTKGPNMAFFANPIVQAAALQHVDPTPILQWWNDSGLLRPLHKHLDQEVHSWVYAIIAGGGRTEILDWLLAEVNKPPGKSSASTNRGRMFPTEIIVCACSAGRVDVLDWVEAHKDQLWDPLTSPTYSLRALDAAYRNGHLRALQWLAEHGYLSALRAAAVEADGTPSAFDSQCISFVPEKWPECLECLEWSLANDFKVTMDKRKEFQRPSKWAEKDRRGYMYALLMQDKLPWAR